MSAANVPYDSWPGPAPAFIPAAARGGGESTTATGAGVAVPLNAMSCLLAAIVLLLALNLGVMAWREWGKPHDPAPLPAPAPDTAVVAATRAYLATLPGAYTATADAIDAGRITDAQGTFASLQGHAQPLANALNVAIKGASDDKGKFTRPAEVSAMLRSVGATLAKEKGGK